MKGIDKIEFYMDGEDKHIAVVDSSMPPVAGDIIVIRNKPYRVVRRQFCVDHTDEWPETAMRVCVDLVPHTPDAEGKKRSQR